MSPNARGSQPLFINKQKYETTADTLTGRAIKALAGYGDDFDLFLLQGEGDKRGTPVQDEQIVPIKPGMHFRSLPRDRNFGQDGQGLPPELTRHVERIREQGHALEIVVAGNEVGLVFPAFSLPEELFNTRTTRLLVRASTNPHAALDMFWTSPELRLKSGAVPQAADTMEVHFGESWRRFSWHWNRPWNPGRDNVVTYLDFVEERLLRGV